MTAVDLVQGRCATLAPENREDVAILALSQDGRLLLNIDCKGHALLLNFVRNSVLNRINFKMSVFCATWSPDNEMFAITLGRKVRIYHAPRMELGWQFVEHRTYGAHMDDIIDITWAPNSLFLATSSRDLSVRLWPIDPMSGFEPVVLAEHRSHVRGAFFSADMEYLYSLSRDGVLVSLRYEEEEGEVDKEIAARPLYCRPGSWSMAAKAYCQQPGSQKVTRCAYDASSRLLAAGFSQGIFMLFEMPDFNAVQTLSLGNDPLDAVALGAKGDWLAVGSSEVGQLLVWEWRSETYVLKQQGHHWGVQCVAFSPSSAPSLKRQKTLATAEGRPEDRGGVVAGRMLATGGYDGKVKVFNSQSGLCFVTFAEHTAAISGICFTPQGNAVLTASKDGSVRAFDLLRYRNFRTFACPDGLCQFGGITVDSGGEIVAASSAGADYTIYVWSIQTGTVLEVLTSHTSFVQTVQFSPSTSRPGQLVSGDWAGTILVWDLYTSEQRGGGSEKLQCGSSVQCIAFDPRANDQCAASCMSGQVQFWDVGNAVQVASLDGLRDIQSGRQWHERFSSTHKRGEKAKGLLGKNNTNDAVNFNQHFTALAYARGGELLLCASRNSPNVCLYDTTAYTLASRLTLTTNQSLSGIKVLLNSKHMTEAGVPIQEFDLSDSEGEDDPELARKHQRVRQTTSLPGVHIGEAKSRYAEREFHVWDVAFSADSQQFAAATTHGVFVYSEDTGFGAPATSSIYGGEVTQFVPQMLTKSVSAPAVLKALDTGDLSKAMILALALNDHMLLRQVYEKVPVQSIPIVVSSIGAPLLPGILRFLGLELRPSIGSPHFQFHVRWITAIIDIHFNTLMEMSAGKDINRTGGALEVAAASRSDVAALCLQLLVELSQRHTAMVKTFDSNIALLRYLGFAPQKIEDEEEEEPAQQPNGKAKGKGKRKREREVPVAAQKERHDSSAKASAVQQDEVLPPAVSQENGSTSVGDVAQAASPSARRRKGQKLEVKAAAGEVSAGGDARGGSATESTHHEEEQAAPAAEAPSVKGPRKRRKKVGSQT